MYSAINLPNWYFVQHEEDLNHVNNCVLANYDNMQHSYEYEYNEYDYPTRITKVETEKRGSHSETTIITIKYIQAK